ncbi:hypothetical protein DAETH_10260 [Deinococcus aetherius]|uniref:Uncharacterized protein n=1 Tax=Deinococcus aetherius TaxID=200252 RepID=A0ABM8ABD0_9DEIO|nr:hypothetical protein [Deinococcus aetherius]BDP41057.1 hypothetical protein DAETH_10260 [Deinococcus aetherius]
MALLESLGPVTSCGRFSLLSAWPVRVQGGVPERPGRDALFPAWLGGLKCGAARASGLRTPDPEGEPGWWGLHPSGPVWGREAGTLEAVGEAGHVDWAAVLSRGPASLPTLDALPFGADDGRRKRPGGRAGVDGERFPGRVPAMAGGEPQLFMAFLDLSREVVVSCSPERRVLWEGVSARPSAGIRRRGDTPEEDAALVWPDQGPTRRAAGSPPPPWRAVKPQ